MTSGLAISQWPPNHAACARRDRNGRTMASGLRLPEPPHRIFDIVGLKLSPALDLGLISVLRVFLEILTGKLPRERLFFRKLLSDEWVFHVSRLPEGPRRNELAG